MNGPTKKTCMGVQLPQSGKHQSFIPHHRPVYHACPQLGTIVRLWMLGPWPHLPLSFHPVTSEQLAPHALSPCLAVSPQPRVTGTNPLWTKTWDRINLSPLHVNWLSYCVIVTEREPTECTMELFSVREHHKQTAGEGLWKLSVLRLTTLKLFHNNNPRTLDCLAIS